MIMNSDHINILLREQELLERNKKRDQNSKKKSNTSDKKNEVKVDKPKQDTTEEIFL